MGPTRTGKAIGAFQFDRVFPGIGRIKRSSGTTNVREFRRRDALLTKLFEMSAVEVLRAFKDGKVTIEEIVEADRSNNVALSLARLATTSRLAEAIDAALPYMGTAPSTRQRYRRSFDRLFTLVPELRAARVGDLAHVEWSALSERWGKSAADWNHLTRAVSRFLSVHLDDKYHPLRREVMRSMPRRAEVPRTPDQSAELFLKIVAAMPVPAQPCFLTLALTGMRIGEYVWADRSALRPETRSVCVNGKTGEGVVYLTEEGYALAEAAIPCPLAPAPTPGQETGQIKRYGMMHRLYRRAQQEVGVSGLRLHDIRHLFGQTAADAGVATAQTQAQLRHTDPRMTLRYEMPAKARAAAQAVAERLGITPRKQVRKQARKGA